MLIQKQDEENKVTQRREAEAAAAAALEEKKEEIKRKLAENEDVQAAHTEAAAQLKVHLCNPAQAC